ncbi:MAG: hypothetical protein Q4G27_08225 [Flavobacteriaceae bacterium]|nr:hypothetical protein [Flavobacteriaceae bacterium]
MALFPFILLKNKELKLDNALINHERIHLKQQVELLIFPFYLWYIIEYIYRLFQFKNAALAYRNISFEREAYENDQNLDYLKHRKWYAFLDYL